MIIYKATCLVNNKVYIGQTKRTLEKRKYYHLNSVKRKKYFCPKFHRAIEKYGEKNFIWEIIVCDCNDFEELNELEIKYIAMYDSINNGYNICEGGVGVIGLNKGKTYEEMYGVKKAIELKELRSKTFKGKKFSIKRRKQISLSKKGKKASDETRKKLSECRKGDKNHFYGKKHSEEVKKLIGSKSKNRNWFKGDRIIIDEKIFYDIILNLSFNGSIIEEISKEYFIKTGQIIRGKMIRKIGSRLGFPFNNGQGNASRTAIKIFVNLKREELLISKVNTDVIGRIATGT